MLSLKIEHRAAMRHQAKVHARATKKKKQELKEADMLVVGMREMFSELLDEMKDKRQETRKAVKLALQLESRAASLQNRLAQWKAKCENLRDVIETEEKVAADTSEKAEEYEAIIDVMEADFQRQLADQEGEYKSIIAYMDEYYSEVVDNLSPRYIRKHWVKNKGRGKQP